MIFPVLLVGLLSTGLTLAARPSVVPAGGGGADQTFLAQLDGDAEVPANSSRARGIAVFHVVNDDEALAFKLIVANIENVVAAHIHLAPEGVNGPVVAFLFGPEPPGGGRSSGVLARDVIHGEDLLGPLAGMSLDALLDEIRAGNAYVNVHTNDGEAPTNTGPGDFPGGEIRGQIR